MNPTGFLAPSWAWLFLLVIPLVIVYFLKLKRPRLEIPSLVLWHSVINDQRVNSPFQRFRKHLLLWLQLLILCSLILAVMQPFLRAGPESSENLPILVDCSASMGALDREHGRTRMELAKERVEELIERALPNRTCLVAVDATARRLTEFTNNKRLLRKALEKLTVRDVTSNLEDGLRMAQALARRVPISAVALVSDGNFPDQEMTGNRRIANVDVELPFELKYEKLPAAGANLGIIAFNARRQTATEVDGTQTPWDVFVRVDGSPDEETSGEAVLEQDGQPIDRLPFTLSPGQSQRLVFHVEAAGTSSLMVKIEPLGFDALASDNRAYLDLPVSRSLLVWCDPELMSFRHALDPLPGVTVFPDAGEAGQSEVYDLAITETDEHANSPIDAAVRLVVGRIPVDLQKLISTRSGTSTVIDWNKNSLLLQHVSLDSIEISDEPVRGEAVRDQDFREAGYEILATGRTGPLVLAKRSPARLSFHLLFHTDRSTLPYRVGFPVLVKNAIEISRHEVGLAEIQGQPTRVLRPQALEPNQYYRIVGPDGITHRIRTGLDGILSGVPAPRVGRYRILEGGTEIARVGAGILDATESSLVGVEEIIPRDKELKVTAASSPIETDRPLWPSLAMIAFFVLLVEWWYFQKKAAGATG
ncbi:MAG: BatA and WFA domain-containing protein [Planctomycetaceae bacterium]